MNSIIPVTFHGNKETVIYTRKLHQYDKGVYLRVSGVALPEKYQAIFSNDEREGVGAAAEVSGSDIRIPDAYLQTGKYIYVWLYFGERYGGDGSSVYTIVVPVEKRPAMIEIEGGAGGDIVATLDEETHTLVFDYR